MKTFHQVNNTRKEYHRDPNLNSVHRSSLLVPEIKGTEASIAFLNHFLLKRGYKKVGCKITAVGVDGMKIKSNLVMVTEPIVYDIKLTGMTEIPVTSYMVEFFAGENLFIPFPAVMINHKGKGFINQVHAYNRVLNDIFEDDEINTNQVKESSIDIVIDEKTDTFILFSVGAQKCNGCLEIEIDTDIYGTLNKSIPINLPKFATKIIKIKKVFPGIPYGIKGILKIKQPYQQMFYGRILSGQVTKDEAFSANHSYYDTSQTEEYWNDDRDTEGYYPFFKDIINQIRVYPVVSPSNLILYVKIFDNQGRILKVQEIGDLTSPDNHFLQLDINSILGDKIPPDTVNSYSLLVRTTKQGKMPTRISHQIVFGESGSLNTSINVALFNPNIFTPPSKKSFKWGQSLVSNEYNSIIAIVADKAENPLIDYHDVKCKFYNINGIIAIREFALKNGTSKQIDIKKELEKELSNIDMNKVNYIWCMIESEHYGITFFSLAYNINTRIYSGDHGF